MNRIFLNVAAAALSTAALVGCQANTYQPGTTETGLAAYAAKAVYPDKLQAETAPDVFCDITPDGTITIYNAGDEAFADFEIWAKQTYTLHVPKLEARSKIMLSPSTFYNNTGSNMGGAPGSSINTIQIYSNGKLWKVKGPIFQH